jgi:hypothetical protein
VQATADQFAAGKGQHGSATRVGTLSGPREIAAAVEIMTSKLCVMEISDLNWTVLHCPHCLDFVPTPRLTLTFGSWIVIGQGSPKLWGPTPGMY